MLRLDDVLAYQVFGNPDHSLRQAILFMVAMANEELAEEEMLSCPVPGFRYEIFVDQKAEVFFAAVVNVQDRQDYESLGGITFEEFASFLKSESNEPRAPLRFAAHRLKFYLSPNFWGDKYEWSAE